MKRWQVLLLVIFAVALLTIGASYMAGAIILATQDIDYKTVQIDTFYRYWASYKEIETMRKPLKGAIMASVVVCYIIPLFIVVAATQQRRSLYGDARFANGSEINKSGLLDQGDGLPGILLGKYRDRYLSLKGALFAILAAPTRSGKGVSSVIPNLLNWPHSAVVLDVKQENYNITSGYRRKYGQDVHLFDPFTEDGSTSRYNPLSYVRDGDFKIGDLISIGEVFFPSHGSKDSFWDDQARNLFVGLALMVNETKGLPFTVGEILRQSSGKGQPIDQYLRGIIEERNFDEVMEIDEETGDEKKTLVRKETWDGKGQPPLSDECVDMLNRFVNTSDNTRSSILSSFNAPLLIWSNPIVDAATSASDFDLRDVRRKRTSIYIGVTPKRMAEAGRLINLLFSQLINENITVLPEYDDSLKYQCLLVLDEMTALGTIKVLDKANAYIAGYGLRILTIIQSPAQLQNDMPRGYGKEGAKTLISNHAAKIIFSTKEVEDQESISKSLGYQTVKSKSHNRQSGGKGSSTNESDHRRELLLPQEVGALGQENEIVIVDNIKPILCKKIMYYKDRAFMDRLADVSQTLKTKYKTKFPSESMFKQIVRDGELRVQPNHMDLNLHKAIVADKVRPIAEQDEIKLEAIAIATTPIDLDDSGNARPEEVERYVNDFFGSLIDEDDANIADDYIDEEPVVDIPEVDPSESIDLDVLDDESRFLNEVYEASDDVEIINLNVLEEI